MFESKLRDMQRRQFFVLSCGLGAALALTQAARGATMSLGPAGNYNVYVLGNDTQAGSDIGSLGIAVGGNFQTAGTTVHGDVIVGGNFTNSGNTVDGNLIANSINWTTPSAGKNVSAVTSANFGNSGGSVSGIVTYGTTYVGPNYFNTQQGSTTLPLDFNSINNGLVSLSASLQSLAQTPGAIVNTDFSHLYLTGSGSDSYVFHVTASQLANMNDFQINVTSATPSVTPTVVVDVDGASDSFHNNGMSLNGTDVNHVLYNFSSATSLVTNGIGIQGSLLAPGAAVNFNGGNINGTLIAGSLAGNGESHSFQFTGVLTPEPASAMTAIVAGAGMMLRRRRTGR